MLIVKVDELKMRELRNTVKPKSVINGGLIKVKGARSIHDKKKFFSCFDYDPEIQTKVRSHVRNREPIEIVIK